MRVTCIKCGKWEEAGALPYDWGDHVCSECEKKAAQNASHVDAQHIRECLDEKKRNDQFKLSGFINSTIKYRFMNSGDATAFITDKDIKCQLNVSMSEMKKMLIERGFKVEEVMDHMTCTGLNVML